MWQALQRRVVQFLAHIVVARRSTMVASIASSLRGKDHSRYYRIFPLSTYLEPRTMSLFFLIYTFCVCSSWETEWFSQIHRNMPSNASIGYFFIMRNPVDRAVSDYYYRIKHEPYHPLRVPSVKIKNIER